MLLPAGRDLLAARIDQPHGAELVAGKTEGTHEKAVTAAEREAGHAHAATPPRHRRQPTGCGLGVAGAEPRAGADARGALPLVDGDAVQRPDVDHQPLAERGALVRVASRAHVNGDVVGRSPLDRALDGAGAAALNDRL